jgi:hypothetical protein
MRMFLEPLEGRICFSAVLTSLISDKFNAASVSTKVWHQPSYDPNGSTFLGRTQLKTAENEPMPKVENGAVRLTLDAYNRTSLAGSPSFYGSELISNKTFSVGTGLDMIVAARFNGSVPKGIVGGLFLYKVKPDGVNHDEIDTEMLSNSLGNIETNVYANEPLGAGSPLSFPLPAGDLTGYHVYEMTVMPTGTVLWHVDRKLIRTETQIVPTGPLQAYLNIWAPASDWTAAYSAGIQPTDRARRNQEWSMSVDYVGIRQVRLRGPRAAVPAGVNITHVPAFGSAGNASGTVTGMKLRYQSGVAVYIKVGGGWWSKPYFDSPLTAINSDGTRSANIATGGDDVHATEIRAYLIPNGFTVPVLGGGASLPDSLSKLLHAIVTR